MKIISAIGLVGAIGSFANTLALKGILIPSSLAWRPFDPRIESSVFFNFSSTADEALCNLCVVVFLFSCAILYLARQYGERMG